MRNLTDVKFEVLVGNWRIYVQIFIEIEPGNVTFEFHQPAIC